MVSSEGLVRGIDRTLEYAEFTEEERPVSIQIFGGDPGKMAEAARIVEGMGADIVDVNMGCPVPKIAKHNAGCSLMREPEHAASVIEAMTKAVKIPVTVKMRAGWNDAEAERADAGEDGRGCRRRGGRGPRPHRRAELQRDRRTGSSWRRSPTRLSIPVFGSGDCVEPRADRRPHGRRASRACSSAAACCAIRGSWRRRPISSPAATPRQVTRAERGRFLLDVHRAAACDERVARGRASARSLGD